MCCFSYFCFSRSFLFKFMLPSEQILSMSSQEGCIYLRYEGQTTLCSLMKVVAVWGPTSGLSSPPSDSLWSQKRRGKLSWSKARLSLSGNDGRWKACPPLQRRSCARWANSESWLSGVDGSVTGCVAFLGPVMCTLTVQNRNADSNVFLLVVKSE